MILKGYSFRKLLVLHRVPSPQGKATDPNKDLSAQPRGRNKGLPDGKVTGKGQLYLGCFAKRTQILLPRGDQVTWNCPHPRPGLPMLPTAGLMVIATFPGKYRHVFP